VSTEQTFAPDRCPLCGGPNDCAMVKNDPGTCWCFSTPIPDAVLAQLPEEARNVACVCRACAAKSPRETASAAHAPAPSDATTPFADPLDAPPAR